MHKVTHDFVNIISPPIKNAEEIEALYCELEQRFPYVLPEGLVFPMYGRERAISDRIGYLDESLKNNKGVSLGHASLDVYFTFKNMEYPLGKTGSYYCQLMLGIKRSTVLLAKCDWCDLIASICERLNAYWGLFSPGDDYYQISNFLQRALFSEEGYAERNKDVVEQNWNLLNSYKELDQLPNLDLARYIYRMRDAHIVPEIRWVNYWCKDIVEYNGIQDAFPLALADCNGHFEKRESGSCIWSLTPEPLSVSNEIHRGCLIKAFQVFPKIGLRL